MSRFRLRVPSPALIIALIALFVALGGTGYAVTKLGRNTVGAAQIRANAVGTSEVKNGALQTKDFSSAAQSALRGAKGDKGDKGDRGDTGPSTGAAGGDLAGSFPNPAIADGKVTSAKLAGGAVTPDKISGVPTVTVFATSPTAVTNTTNTPIAFAGEEDDQFAMHDPGNPTALVAPRAGVYLVTGEFTWDNNVTGLRVIAVCPSGRARCVGDNELPASVTGATDGTMNIVTQVRLAAGESVVFDAFQNSGATRNIQVLSSPPETSVRAEMSWVAP